ncbi:hypothetical protein F2Q69_00042260 [Brassica cretica]|uniref:Uncharacterized protein n=1 Tax=Brassica cretica TaxID=69181 RepID=A0A8S9NB98_BRACR|nr:hypothetical protein F2Q69_00042260 [Brassica cretica]
MGSHSKRGLRERERKKVADLEYTSPDQPVEACQFLHGEAEVLSKSRLVKSSPVKSSLGYLPSPLRSTSCFSPRTLPPASPIEDRGTAIPIEDRDRVIPERLRLCGVIVKGLPVALGKDDRIAWFWTSWSKVCDSDRIVPSPSRSASEPWCWVGRSVMFLFDCWLAGWPFISNPGCWTVDRSCSCLIVGRWVDLCLGRFGGVTSILHRLQDIIRSLELPLYDKNHWQNTASGSPLEGTPVPRIPARRNSGSPLWSFPGIKFLQAPGMTPASGSPLEGTPVPGIPVGTKIHTVDFHLNNESRKTLISQMSGYLLIPHAKQSEHEVEASAMRAVGKIPSSNNLRQQNLVESQLEITKTESCLIALSDKFALNVPPPCLSPRTPYILAPRKWICYGLRETASKGRRKDLRVPDKRPCGLTGTSGSQTRSKDPKRASAPPPQPQGS